MKLRISDSIVCEYPNAAQIAEALASLAREKEGFASLERDDLTYLQTAINAEGFCLECQEGSTKKHHYCPDILSLGAVTKAFKSYAEGTGEWRTEYSWDKDRTCKTKKSRIRLGFAFLWLIALLPAFIGGIAPVFTKAYANAWAWLFVSSIGLCMAAGATFLLKAGKIKIRSKSLLSQVSVRVIRRTDSPGEFWFIILALYLLAIVILLGAIGKLLGWL